MPTPDLEEWLRRQDFPIEETVTLERWLSYLESEFGIHKGSLEVAKEIFEERYEFYEPLGIRAVERHYTVRGEPMVETRYVIKGYRGLWGRERMLEIAEELAEERGEYTWAERARRMREEEE